MKVHQLFAFLAIMLIGLNAPALGAEDKATAYKATMVGVT